jgi:hypothetical protein
VDPDEASGPFLAVVEVLVPGPVVDNDQVAGLPRVVHAVDLAVARPRDHVEPCLAAVPVAQLVEAGPRPPVDPLPVDLGPAESRFDEHDRVPGVPMDRRRRGRRDLVDGRVQVLRGAVAVPAGEDPPAHPTGRDLDHGHVGPLERLVVPAPLLEQCRPALLLDFVVGDLRRCRRLHRRYYSPQAPTELRSDTFGMTSRARISTCWSQSGKRIRKSKMIRSAPISW